MNVDQAAATMPADTELLLERVRGLSPLVRENAAEAERMGCLPDSSATALLQAGLARTLVPRRFGGLELDLGIWLDIVLEVARADASHGWCASLLVHHPHYVAQMSLAAQEAVWADGPDAPIAVALAPQASVVPDGDDYRVSGHSPFMSGITHSRWILVGGMLPEQDGEGPALFLIPPGEYAVQTTWDMAGMRGTGSNTAVTDGVRVPGSHVLRIEDLREGRAPGAEVNHGPIYRAPWMSYAPLTFAMPLVGAALGALEHTIHTGSRKFAERPGAQVGLGRAASDLDLAEMLLRRAVAAAQTSTPAGFETRARAMRDATRAVELSVAAVDTLIGLGGSSIFATSHPVQRAWRDVHFGASHVALTPDANFGHWGRVRLGLPTASGQQFY